MWCCSKWGQVTCDWVPGKDFRNKGQRCKTPAHSLLFLLLYYLCFFSFFLFFSFLFVFLFCACVCVCRGLFGSARVRGRGGGGSTGPAPLLDVQPRLLHAGGNFFRVESCFADGRPSTWTKKTFTRRWRGERYGHGLFPRENLLLLFVVCFLVRHEGVETGSMTAAAGLVAWKTPLRRH